MNENMEWDDVAVLLWGEDFVAPLSECLGVNRRTVSRWKTGVIDIPSDIRQAIIECTPHQTMTRELGETMRKIAAGDSPSDVKRGLEAQASALLRFKSMQKSGAHLAQIITAQSLDNGERDPEPGEMPGI